MRNGLLGAVAAFAAGAGLAFGQSPSPPTGRSTASAPPVISAIPTGTAPQVYEPLATTPPADPTLAGSPALDMFGPGGPEDARPHITRAWIKGDYLLWAVKQGPSRFMPLIVIGTIPAGAVPGAPGSLTVFGGGDFDWGAFSGARVTAGMLFPGSKRIGVEAEGLILERKDLTAAAASGPLGIPVIGAPFINELTGTLDSVLASSPGNPGSMSADANTRLWTAEINLYANLYRGPSFSFNVITGFKHFNLAEGIIVHANRRIGSAGQTFEGNPLPVGARVAWEDDFNTTNRFFGWEFGIGWELRYRCWYWSADLHNAIGSMRESVDNSSFTQVTTGTGAAAVTTQVPGGVLVQTTNIGRRVRDHFADIPEIRTEVGYQLSRHMRFAIGYSFLYASNVVRPGDQVDAVVNPTLVPLRPEFGLPAGSARPIQVFRHTDYWAQGVNWSLTLMY